jgi:hypothetical protein
LTVLANLSTPRSSARRASSLKARIFAMGGSSLQTLGVQANGSQVENAPERKAHRGIVSS